jgi:thiosulfate dehydrogenase
VSAALAVAAGLALAACGGDDDPIAAAEVGRDLFRDPGFSTSQFNAFSCATCHALAGDDVRPGYALANSAFRASWWGGYEATLKDAIDFCLVFFMRGDELEPEDDGGRALHEYLISISPERPSPALPMTVVAVIEDVPRRDAGRGEAVWNQACRPCHGDPHTGRGRISELVVDVPEASEELAAQLGVDVSLIVIEKVRHGQFFGVGGNMPFFSREAMTDEDLGALLAYLGL